MFNVFVDMVQGYNCHYICGELDGLHSLITMLEKYSEVSQYYVMEWDSEYSLRLWQTKKNVSKEEWYKTVH